MVYPFLRDTKNLANFSWKVTRYYWIIYYKWCDDKNSMADMMRVELRS